MTWSVPPGTDPSQVMNVILDGENFDPETKYHVRVIPIGVVSSEGREGRGESDRIQTTKKTQIEGPPSTPKDFDTKLGIVAPDKPLVHVDVEDNILRVPAGTDYTVAW